MTYLQQTFYDTDIQLGVQDPILATPGLLNMILDLRLLLNHRGNLKKGIHQFLLGQHTSAARKLLKGRVDQHQVITGSGGAPTLANADYLTAPNGVSLTETLDIACSTHMHL